MTGARLRKCPTCLTPVEDAKLGLRDYKWLGNALPNRVSPMDIDFVIERKGHVLGIEFKPDHGALGLGQRLTYRTLVRQGWDIWLVKGDGTANITGNVEVGAMDRAGEVKFSQEMTVDVLAEKIAQWFREASG